MTLAEAKEASRQHVIVNFFIYGILIETFLSRLAGSLNCSQAAEITTGELADYTDMIWRQSLEIQRAG